MDWYMAVVLFAAANTVTPGINNMMIMSSGLNFGIRKSIPHLMGILIGFPLMFIAVGAGFVSVILVVPELHLLIQVVGVLYLLYFAWLIATSADRVDASTEKVIGFWQAVAIQWVNPKAWIMITGAFAAFTKTDADPFLQVLYITSAFVIVGIPTITAWLFCGSLLSRVLKRIESRRVFNRCMAGLLVISILPIISKLLKDFF
jgi:threonine/homoserine/homoserine lactone efflux protein